MYTVLQCSIVLSPYHIKKEKKYILLVGEKENDNKKNSGYSTFVSFRATNSWQ